MGAVPNVNELPAVTVVEITEPTAVNAGIELLDQAVVQLESMPLRARRIIVRLGPATVVFHSTNLRVRTRTSVQEGLVAFVAFGPRAEGSVNGLPVRPGLMLFAEPRAEAVFLSQPGWESVAILIPPRVLCEELAARRREDEFHLPRGVETLQADPQKVRELFDWGKRLVRAAERRPSLFDDSGLERHAAHVELVDQLLAAFGDAATLETSRNDVTRQSHGRVVKAAEAYAISRAGGHIHVGDLCTAAAASERTLEVAFREVTGLTPMAYLVRLRLHRVRDQLLKATHGSTTVSTEALKWGFWHFGEFARAYKDCFGELPSDTLRKKPVP